MKKILAIEIQIYSEAYLQTVAAEHKLHNSSVLPSLEERKVLLGLLSSTRQRDIIVVMRWRLLCFVVHTLFGSFAARLGIHQRLVVCAALIICPVPHNCG